MKKLVILMQPIVHIKYALMLMYRHSFFLLLAFLLASCEKVKVVVDRADIPSKRKHQQLVIDNEPVKLEDTTFAIYLSNGTHQIRFDKEPVISIQVDENGGMINFDNREYVAYEILYMEKNDLDNSHYTNSLDKKFNDIMPSAAVLLDSVLVARKDALRDTSNNDLKNILPELMHLKNGNLIITKSKFIGVTNDSYDESETVYGLKKFGKDKVYIKKFWSYDINESPPDEIEGEKQAFRTLSNVKTGVMSATAFLLYATMNRDEYVVKSMSGIGLRPDGPMGTP